MTKHVSADRADNLARRASQAIQDLLGRQDSEVAAALHELALRCEALGLQAEAESLWAAARAVIGPVVSRAAAAGVEQGGH